MPLLHILDPTINAIITTKMTTVGRFGTGFTMSETFYRDELFKKDTDCIVPDTEQQEIIHRIIEQELVRGI